MEFSRRELQSGVFFTCLQDAGFPHSTLSIHLLCPLNRDLAACQALLPFIFCQGTFLLDSEEKLSKELESLGFGLPRPVIRRYGEVQSVGLTLDGRKDFPLPADGRRLGRLLIQLVSTPATRGGLLIPQYTSRALERMEQAMQAQEAAEEPIWDSVRAMCCFEDYACPLFGDVEELTEYSHLYKKISKVYYSLLGTCPIEIVAAGPQPIPGLEKGLKETLASLPKGTLNEGLGTDIRLNAVEDSPRTRTLESKQFAGSRVLGYRLGEWMDNPDPAVSEVFAALFPAGSLFDLHKGIFAAAEPGGSETTVPARIEALKNISLSGEELQRAKETVQGRLLSIASDPAAAEAFFLSQVILGWAYLPGELAELTGQVTAEELGYLAESLDCDMICSFIAPEENEEE